MRDKTSGSYLVSRHGGSDALEASGHEDAHKLESFAPDINTPIDLTPPGQELVMYRAQHEDAYVALCEAFECDKEFYPHSATGMLFKAGRANALADTAPKFLLNKEHWKKIRRSGRIHVETERNWKVSVVRHQNVYAWPRGCS